MVSHNGLATPPPFDALNPYPWFAWMRQHEQVYQVPNTQSWYVFGYHDVLRVLNPPLRPTAENPIVFSAQLSTGAEHDAIQDSILFTDPPRQRAIRDLLTPAFSPKALQDRYTAPITSIIDELLDQVIEAEEMDVVTTLAYEIPAMVIAALLDIPKEDHKALQHWTARGIGEQKVEAASLSHKVPELEEYLLRAINRRRQYAPTDHPDLITTLVHSCPHDGVALNEAELLGNSELLLIAGFESTAHLLTNLFRVLDAFPEVQEQVWQDPTLVAPLIEETLRYLSPTHFLIHRTTKEVELGGKVIPENQVIMPLLGSANRDEQVFAGSESFELMRFAQTTPNHVAFGFRGTHFCLGAPLARLEAALMMQRLIERIEQIRVVPGIPLNPLLSNLGMVPPLNGVRSLPVTFKHR